MDRRTNAGAILARALTLVFILLGVAPGARAQEKFSLSMFHFNVQYVAGGLEGFPDGESDIEEYDLDNAAVEDLIITESFEPALDLLLVHPSWKLTLELQGYMVEVMLERHPAIVDKLRQLVDAGQVELVSFHYSDQLFLAYPRLDMVRSHALLDEVMQEAGLTLSPVVFCQEGQFGEGIATLAPEHGQTILGLPKNLFRYQHDDLDDDPAPLYELDGTDVVLIGKGVDATPVQVTWSFFDDGELWSTGDRAPYLGTKFRIDATAIAEFEAKLEQQEAEGYRIATISEYVDYVKSTDLPQPPLPPLLDGTWQPSSSDSMFRWMGKSGALDVLLEFERDNDVITGNVEARHTLLTAETLLSWARQQGLVGAEEYPEGLRACWRLALLGQVTDSTGINPWLGEVRYGLEHGQQARDCGQAILDDIARRAGARWLEVDNATGAVRELGSRPAQNASPTEPLLDEADGFVIDAPGREVEITWETVTLDGIAGTESGNLTRLTLQAGLPRNAFRYLEVRFPLELPDYRLTPGLVEDEVRSYPRDAFTWEEGGIAIPLGNGLLGLREDLWLIKHTRHVHVAATFYEGEDTVSFRDETLDPEGEATWVFYLLQGSEADALAVANRLNTHPTEYVPDPDATDDGGDSGCGCGAAGTPPPAGLALLAWLALAWIGVRRRRRRR
jgi:MYXO-CTERM domain-containing protein